MAVTVNALKLTQVQGVISVRGTAATGTIYYKHTCKKCTNEFRKQLALIKQKVTVKSHNVPCEICRRTMGKSGRMRMILDHDHKTGKLRGLICNDCNTSIGKFNDDPKLLMRGFWYLVRGEKGFKTASSYKNIVFKHAQES